MTRRKVLLLLINSNYCKDNEKRVEYDRTLLFPLTRWIQQHRGERITHKKLCEFRALSTEVYGNVLVDIEGDFDNPQKEGINKLIESVRWAVMHV